MSVKGIESPNGSSAQISHSMGKPSHHQIMQKSLDTTVCITFKKSPHILPLDHFSYSIPLYYKNFITDFKTNLDFSVSDRG